MGHTVKEKSKLLNRVRRLRGQVDAIERALEAEAGCAKVMQLVVSVRGAANGLMAEIMEDHTSPIQVMTPTRSEPGALDSSSMSSAPT